MSDGQCRVWEVQDVDAGAKQMLGIISIDGGMVDWCTPLAMGEPDTDDPATLGGLLALVREAWPSDRTFGSEVAWTIEDPELDGWVCGVPGGGQFDGVSEAAALVAALEAAP